MTPAEREALKRKIDKAGVGGWTFDGMMFVSDSEGNTVCNIRGFGSGMDERYAQYVAAVSPEKVKSLLSLISSLELTLSNATNLLEMQEVRIGKLETEHSALKLKYVLCDSDIPAGFSPDLEPGERISAYIGKVRECLIDHHRLHGVRCFHSSRAECPTMQLTEALLAAPTEPTPVPSDHKESE